MRALVWWKPVLKLSQNMSFLRKLFFPPEFMKSSSRCGRPKDFTICLKISVFFWVHKDYSSLVISSHSSRRYVELALADSTSIWGSLFILLCFCHFQCLPQTLQSCSLLQILLSQKQQDSQTKVTKGPTIYLRVQWPQGSWNWTWLERDWRSEIEREWQ